MFLLQETGSKIKMFPARVFVFLYDAVNQRRGRDDRRSRRALKRNGAPCCCATRSALQLSFPAKSSTYKNSRYGAIRSERHLLQQRLKTCSLTEMFPNGTLKM